MTPTNPTATAPTALSLPVSFAATAVPANELATYFGGRARAGREPGAETQSSPVEIGAQDRGQRGLLLTGTSSRQLIRQARKSIAAQNRVLLTDNTGEEWPDPARQAIEII